MAVLPKLIYRLNAITIRIPSDFFVEIDKLFLKLIKNFCEPRIIKTIPKKEQENRSCLTSQFQNFLQSNSNQESIYWHKDRCIDQWNKTESSEIIHLSSTDFCKGAKTIQWGRNGFSTDSVGTTGFLHTKRVKLNSCFTIYMKINSKGIKDLNVLKLQNA
jgi:hypothetical protein